MRTSSDSNCSSARLGGAPRPSPTWHSEHWLALKVGPRPQSPFSETTAAHLRWNTLLPTMTIWGCLIVSTGAGSVNADWSARVIVKVPADRAASGSGVSPADAL